MSERLNSDNADIRQGIRPSTARARECCTEDILCARRSYGSDTSCLERSCSGARQALGRRLPGQRNVDERLGRSCDSPEPSIVQDGRKARNPRESGKFWRVTSAEKVRLRRCLLRADGSSRHAAYSFVTFACNTGASSQWEMKNSPARGIPVSSPIVECERDVVNTFNNQRPRRGGRTTPLSPSLTRRKGSLGQK